MPRGAGFYLVSVFSVCVCARVFCVCVFSVCFSVCVCVSKSVSKIHGQQIMHYENVYEFSRERL